MEEITRPSPAHKRSRSPDAALPIRRHPLRATLLIGMVLVPVLCALTFAAAAYASTATIRLPPVDSRTLGRIAASFLPTPPSPIPPPTATPLPTFQPQPTQFVLPTVAFASQTPFASPSASPTPTESGTPTPSLTPTFTITPTFTATYTPTATATASSTATTLPTATLTPSRTPTNVPPSATNPPAPTATNPPPTATNPPAPTAAPTNTPDPSCAPGGNAGYESTLLSLINQERNDQGLPSYSSNSQLVAAARGHSADMACNEFFSHTGSSGSSVGQRVSAQGYSWSWVGENIYAGSSATPQSAFNWWMNSAPHQANLLNSNYQDIGIGYVNLSGSPYGGYFTAVFARP